MLYRCCLGDSQSLAGKRSYCNLELAFNVHAFRNLPDFELPEMWSMMTREWYALPNHFQIQIPKLTRSTRMEATSTHQDKNEKTVIRMETGGINKSEGILGNQCMKTMTS